MAAAGMAKSAIRTPPTNDETMRISPPAPRRSDETRASDCRRDDWQVERFRSFAGLIPRVGDARPGRAFRGLSRSPDLAASTTAVACSAEIMRVLVHPGDAAGEQGGPGQEPDLGPEDDIRHRGEDVPCALESRS